MGVPPAPLPWETRRPGWSRRRKTITVCISIIAVVGAGGAAYYILTLPSKGVLAPEWTANITGLGQAGVVVNGTYYGYTANYTYSPGCFGGNTGESFTAFAVDLTTGTRQWTSPTTAMVCPQEVGLVNLVSVLPGRDVLTINTGEGGESDTQVIFDAFDPTTGALLQSVSYSYPNASVGSSVEPVGQSAGWPVADGLVGTWYPVNGTALELQTYSLATFLPAWNATVEARPAGLGNQGIGGWNLYDEGAFAAADQMCLVTDPQAAPGSYSSSVVPANGSVACFSAADGAPSWQQPVPGPAQLVGGTASPSTFYFLSNDSGTPTIQGYNLTTGERTTSAPILGDPYFALSSDQLVYADGLLTLTNPGPYSYPATSNPGLGVVQAYLPDGSLSWTQTIPTADPTIGSSVVYTLYDPLALDGGRLVWCDYDQQTQWSAAGATYEQACAVVNSGNGAVVSVSDRTVHETVGQGYTAGFEPQINGPWTPMVASGGTMVFYSSNELVAVQF